MRRKHAGRLPAEAARGQERKPIALQGDPRTRASREGARSGLSAIFETLRRARLAGAIPELATSSFSAERSAADSSRASGMAERAVVKPKPMAPA